MATCDNPHDLKTEIDVFEKLDEWVLHSPLLLL